MLSSLTQAEQARNLRQLGLCILLRHDLQPARLGVRHPAARAFRAHLFRRPRVPGAAPAVGCARTRRGILGRPAGGRARSDSDFQDGRRWWVRRGREEIRAARCGRGGGGRGVPGESEGRREDPREADEQRLGDVWAPKGAGEDWGWGFGPSPRPGICPAREDDVAARTGTFPVPIPGAVRVVRLATTVCGCGTRDSAIRVLRVCARSRLRLPLHDLLVARRAVRAGAVRPRGIGALYPIIGAVRGVPARVCISICVRYAPDAAVPPAAAPTTTTTAAAAAATAAPGVWERGRARRVQRPGPGVPRAAVRGVAAAAELYHDGAAVRRSLGARAWAGCWRRRE